MISFNDKYIGKNKRIKDAQNEAKHEIEQFKAERERRYKALEQQVSYLFLYKLIFSFFRIAIG